MRLVFFNSGAQPGRDGVGDYTRILAGEVASRGHECRIIALNDRHIIVPVEGPNELRLPEKMAWSERRERCLTLLRQFKADWCSVQFVPYGFHPRGIPNLWADRFRELCHGSRVHFMFHEIWIGFTGGVSLKHRVIGWAQRRIIKRILRKLTPRVVHTSNGLYQLELRRCNVDSKILPLFGSVPLQESIAGEPLHPILSSKAHWRVAIFGSLHPVWPPEPLLPMLIEEARKRSLKCALLSIGNIGPGGELWESMERRYPEIDFVRVGEQSSQKIANCFASLDYAIATTPLELLGKSASAAALLEHGLPLIVNSTLPGAAALKFNPRISDQIVTMEELPQRFENIHRAAPRLRLQDIADQFLADLEAAPA